MILPKKPKQTKADETDARELVNLRDNGVCVKCLRIDPFFGVNFDHRVNRSQGGEWSASNGQLMCGSGTTRCHGWATGNPQEAIAEGYAAPGYAEPSEWPARRWLKSAFGLRLAWVLYDDQGGVTEITESDRLERMGLVQDMTEQRDRNG